MKSYRFKLFPNKRKSRRLENELRVFCSIYNHSLALIRGYYKLYGKHLSKNKFSRTPLDDLGRIRLHPILVLNYYLEVC